MKLEDLYLINKEEWLDVIKDKCKKKAKTHFWVGLVLLILFLIFLTMVITFERSRWKSRTRLIPEGTRC